MFSTMRRSFGVARLLPALLVAGVVAGGSYAFTASNTVASAPAGMGESNAFSGYNATTVKWNIQASDPTKIDSVEFNLNPVSATTNVYAGADNGSAISWTGACTLVGTITSGTGHYTCNFGTDPSVAATTKLAVSAAN
jgi:hypothetical protein